MINFIFERANAKRNEPKRSAKQILKINHYKNQQMKITTTKLTIATFASIVTLVLASSFKGQAGKTKYLTVRTCEIGPNIGSRITIVYEDGTVEESNLDVFKPSNMTPNAQKINMVLNKVADKGYELVSSSGGEHISMFTFIKR